MQREIFTCSCQSSLEFKNSIGFEFSYFRLHGRLGNHLFELSEAYFLFRQLGRKILLDITDVLEPSKALPEWISLIDGWDWLIIVMNPERKLEDRFDDLFNMSNYENTKNLGGIFFFEGFRPSISALEESGLFQRGQFPFPISVPKQVPKKSLSISVRVGDYLQNPHLGVLPSSYYHKSIRMLTRDWAPSKVIVFSDDLEASSKILPTVDIEYDFHFDTGMTPLQSLFLLSTSERIIVANSTFSFWGAYFSNAKVVFPNPFYIALPRWHKELLFDSAKEIRHTFFPICRYYLKLLSTYRSRH